MNDKRRLLNPVAVFEAALVLLVTFVLPAYPQSRPSRLTPGVDGAAPGESFRVDIDPVIGMRAQEAESCRMVLRPSGERGPQSDIVLTIVEYHGSWFLVRMPQEIRSRMGAWILFLLNRRGDVLASSGDATFRILSVPRTGQVAPGSRGATNGPVRDRVDPSAGPDPRQGREEVRARQGLTTPGVSGQARETQDITTPGASAEARRLPTPVTDYVGIAAREIVLRHENRWDVTAFTLPSDVRLSDEAVLVFIANPDDSETELKLRINGHEIKNLGFHEGTARTFHVRFNAKGILRPGRNELELSGNEIRVGGIINLEPERKIRIDDIILWFHRDIQW